MPKDVSLRTSVRKALSNYHDADALRDSELGKLKIAQRPSVSTPSVIKEMTNVIATRKVVDRGIQRLSLSAPDKAELLHKRFITKATTPADYMDEQTVSESQFFQYQRKAITALALHIAEMETREIEIAHCAEFLPPPTYIELVGAEKQIAQLHGWLTEGIGRPGLPIILNGLGGIGKTSLLREAVIRWLESQPPSLERVLFAPVSNRVDIGEAASSYALDEVLVTLGSQVDLNLVPLANNERRLQELARRLAQYRCMLIIDNVETLSEVRLTQTILDHLSSVAQTVVTSRQEFQLTKVRPLLLSELEWEDALRLMGLEANKLEVGGLTVKNYEAIFNAIGGHPLALKLVLGQLSKLSIEQVIERLRGTEGAERKLFTHVYAQSWNLLSELAREMMLGLFLLPLEGATWNGLREALRGAGHAPDDETLQSLVLEVSRLNLLQVSPMHPHVYSLHRLTYHFLEQKLGWS